MKRETLLILKALARIEQLLINITPPLHIDVSHCKYAQPEIPKLIEEYKESMEKVHLPLKKGDVLP